MATLRERIKAARSGGGAGGNGNGSGQLTQEHVEAPDAKKALARINEVLNRDYTRPIKRDRACGC